MKKLQQTLVSLATVLGSLAIVPAAGAAGTCENGFTGPDSNNMCTSTTKFTCTQINNNTVQINNDNTQVAVSGDANVSGNTSAGGALTGSASNSNGVMFNVTVKNPATCAVTASVPATPATPTTPVTPATPVTPGRGSVSGGVGALGAVGGAGAVVTPTNTTRPSVLANTSGDNLLGYAAGAVAVLAGLIGTSRLATLTYGRFKS